eukprot:1614531-Prymnesium_polylepis.1
MAAANEDKHTSRWSAIAQSVTVSPLMSARPRAEEHSLIDATTQRGGPRASCPNLASAIRTAGHPTQNPN